MKGQDQDVLSLYNVAVKKQANTSSSNVSSPAVSSTISQKTKKVSKNNIQLEQGSKKQGAYDPELQVIIIGKDFNTGTLPHEMAHFWLGDIFRRATTQNDWTPEFTEQANKKIVSRQNFFTYHFVINLH